MFCRVIEQYKVTFAYIVPPILVVLARHPGQSSQYLGRDVFSDIANNPIAVEKYDIKSLKRLMSGAAPLGPGLTRAVGTRLRSHGAQVQIVQGYGLTETSPVTHILPVGDSERKMGSTGLLLPNLEQRLVTDDGEDAKDGEPGELWMRGPTIMKGYLNNLTATKDCITSDGWFKTGDVAVIDSEGYTSITDRKKELIKYKGFQGAFFSSSNLTSL